jgi:hypothetical protein
MLAVENNFLLVVPREAAVISRVQLPELRFLPTLLVGLLRLRVLRGQVFSSLA